MTSNIPSTTSVSLCQLQAEDIETLRQWRNCEDARRWFKDPSPISAERQKQWFAQYLARSDDVHFAVIHASQVVGFCAIYGLVESRGRAEIGRFLASPQATGRGHMRAACRTLITVSRDVLNLSELVLHVHRDNARAIKLYSRVGFHFQRAADPDEAFLEMRCSL